MLELKYRRFLTLLIASQLVIWAVALTILFLRNDDIADYSQQVMEDVTMDITEDRLRERVETVVLTIDQERTQATREV